MERKDWKGQWEFKKLGEVCELYQPQTISKQQLDDSAPYPVYGANGIIGRYSQFNHKEKELLMTCRGATCGTINISEAYSWINGNAMVIHPKSNCISIYFLRYLFNASDLSSIITGAAQPQITRSTLSNLPIPVPPLPVQARIVDELDCLQGILSKKRQQLAEYHSLAQAIFHQMFGDPVVNEKGWEVKRLGEVCELKAGKNIKASDLKKSHIEGTYPCYGGNDIRGYINRYSHIENHIIIGRQGALCGNVVYACAPFYATEHAVVVTIKQTMQELWLFYTLKYLNLNQYAKGVAQPGLAVGTLNKVFIPIPPSHLQEEFISYVNIIHNQCERLALSIHETEDLLACRMETLLACRMETLLNCPQA